MAGKPRARLDKSAVLRAAVELLDTEGVQALTLSRLAGKLSIQTPSLYNHVDGLAGLQQDLAILNASLLADRLTEAAIGRSGQELLLSAAQAFRDYVKEHPGLYLSTLRSSGTQQILDPRLQQEEERILKVGMAMMSSLGLQGEEAIHGLRAFRSMVHGFASLEVAGGFGLPEDCDESFRRMTLALMTGLISSKGDA
ncbi:MAG: TetR family transcriptional regulator [Anaerolineae bacterium]|nr:TetR family transcriptional regulator [Anaerolineae bacterium]